jgi:D-alanyl-D-alanine carboxypeptidase/D-alanyl-D-alanine-endopeptidase (penicillin-binding protein 4)
MIGRSWVGVVAGLLWALAVPMALAADEDAPPKPIPPEIKAIFHKPLYKNAVWGLRVVDLDTGHVVYDLKSDEKFLTGSVRKLISVGLALEKLGRDYKFTTPVYRLGTLRQGVFTGQLVLVASGDLAMGGRTKADGSLAITNYDHNEANSLGNAALTATNPLAGYEELAQQIAKAGVKEVVGNVIVDDRLFAPFNFRGEFDVRPIFVNDDVVDVMIEPGAKGEAPKVGWRPKSAAFAVESALATGSIGGELQLKLAPEFPKCIGKIGCQGSVTGKLPTGFEPPLTGKYPLVRTFRITEPQNYARTVFIEALQKAGVQVSAAPVAGNDTNRLPAAKLYRHDAKIAELVSPPYAEYAKWILKVSYNIGADTSLVLFGVNEGVTTMSKSLRAEAKTLATEYDIQPTAYHFIDGSGGGPTAATPTAIVGFLQSMHGRPIYETYRNCLPVLATDGSLAFVTDFQKDPSLADAKGKVYAKTGTFLEGSDDGKLTLRAQAVAGYIDTKSDRHLAYALFVNNVSPVSGLEDVLQVFQDEGAISAILWREN